VDDVIAFSESLRKIPVRVQECAGFLVNRLLMPYLNEAALALEEGADPKAIDQAMVAYGMPMGPFGLLDMIGIDVADKVAHILYDAYGPRMQPAALLGELVKAKRFGNKSGAGIYTYDGQEDRVLPEMLARLRASGGRKAPPFTPHRLLLQMINEAALCLQENVATAGDIDMAMIAGTGFPQDKGGPLHDADRIGLDVVLAELNQLCRELGPRFWPAPLLKRMAGAGWIGAKRKQGFFSY
jgi:3-hydroxyacyl-CoA dehydrogenase